MVSVVAGRYKSLLRRSLPEPVLQFFLGREFESTVGWCWSYLSYQTISWLDFKSDLLILARALVSSRKSPASPMLLRKLIPSVYLFRPPSFFVFSRIRRWKVVLARFCDIAFSRDRRVLSFREFSIEVRGACIQFVGGFFAPKTVNNIRRVDKCDRVTAIPKTNPDGWKEFG